MRTRRGWWWAVYGAGAVVVIAALVWITATVLRLERSETEARGDAEQQEALRLALWRMDSWIAPRLAREVGRPYFDYQPFYAQPQAYTRLLYRIEPGEVLTPSPLLSFESEFFRLHFQIAADGTLTSPQAPTGNLRDLAEDTYLPSARIDGNATALGAIGRLLERDEVVACVAASDARGGPSPPPPPRIAAEIARAAGAQRGEAQQLRTQREWSKRQGAYLDNVGDVEVQQADADPAGERAAAVTVGSLVPFWAADETGDELVFVRRVRVGDDELYQGFVTDWPRLRGALLEQIADLFPDASLLPVRVSAADGADGGTMLATIPVALGVPPPPPVALSWASPARSTLALTWLAVLAGMVAVAMTLRASVAFGERRSRFASAVTHELRTPLTTFRMYTEMLADGMVRDEAQRRTYLQTLRDESGRLSALVENVLAYARLEEGRRVAQARTLTVDELLARLTPVLGRRCEDAGMTLRVVADGTGATTLHTDADAVGQILFNLVDNACKYARDAGDRSLELRIARDDAILRISVRDHGAGIPPGQARTIFAPFERGANGGGDKPGIGLGLALARGLARDLGGDLVLQPVPDGGGCFDLTLPLPARE